MEQTIAVLNAGSSSIKFALFDADAGPELARVAAGAIDGVGTAPRFHAQDAKGTTLAERRWAQDAGQSYEALLNHLMSWIETRLEGRALRAAGHRVVFGGEALRTPVRIDPPLLRQLEALVPMMPLHLPHNLAPIRHLLDAYPQLPQVACFDTGFHRTVPRVARLFALPRALTDSGIVRYGFHGLSYEYISGRLPHYDARAAQGRTVVAHLGSGASLCALRGGRSVETTMGISALDGLMMGTRPGWIDPGVLLYLMAERGMDRSRLETLLYHECGLLGVSGISNDMRTLLTSSDPAAAEAVELFCYRLVCAIGSLAAALGGVDALVFTGGIGERAVQVRERVCKALAWLGVALDTQANAAHGPRISTEDSTVSAWVIPTDEDWMIAQHTRAVVASA
jgi:acetate kinase